MADRMIDRLDVLLGQFREQLPILQRNAADPEKDREGSSVRMVTSSLHFIGVAEYILDGNIQSLHHGLRFSAQTQLRLFERAEAGEPISRSYLAMLSYKELYDAIAAGEMKLAGMLARHMGGREKIEKYYNHPFDYTMGYTLKTFVERDQSAMEHWCGKFEAECAKKGNASFVGYAEMFRAILEANEKGAARAVHNIIRGHEKLSKGYGIFKNTDQEVLCIWGIGIVNLTRSYGLNVTGCPPLIPDELLIAPKT